MKKKLKKHLERYPDLYLCEMQEFLFDEYSVVISATRIYQVLKKMKISRKSLRRRAKE